MNPQFLMFVAPDGKVSTDPAQATISSPPAVNRSAAGAATHLFDSVKGLASVIGNAIGFGLMLALCWGCLTLLQSMLP